MESLNGRYVIAFNGEIYNHLQIRSNRKNNNNITWRGHSDTETILRAFETFGIENSIKKFTGMFAISYGIKKIKYLLWLEIDLEKNQCIMDGKILPREEYFYSVLS